MNTLFGDDDDDDDDDDDTSRVSIARSDFTPNTGKPTVAVESLLWTVPLSPGKCNGNGPTSFVAEAFSTARERPLGCTGTGNASIDA